MRLVSAFFKNTAEKLGEQASEVGMKR